MPVTFLRRIYTWFEEAGCLLVYTRIDGPLILADSSLLLPPSSAAINAEPPIIMDDNRLTAAGQQNQYGGLPPKIPAEQTPRHIAIVPTKACSKSALRKLRKLLRRRILSVSSHHAI